VSRVINQYSIHYKGLKIGKHHFEFEVVNEFFEEFAEGEIKRGNLKAFIELNRHSTMLEFSFTIMGEVEVSCDRCLEPFMLPVSYKGDLFVKILEGELLENDDEFWLIGSGEHEVNLAHYIYESICLSLPIQRYHGMLGTKKSDCDKTMLKQIKKVAASVPAKEKNIEDIDPRWEKLKDLKRD
jgi:uncharacterized metal-binding protein YceD (DUF177 family)